MEKQRDKLARRAQRKLARQEGGPETEDLQAEGIPGEDLKPEGLEPEGPQAENPQTEGLRGAASESGHTPE